MKVITLFKTSIIAAIVILTSCTKTNKSVPSGSGPFVAKVDNQSFPKTDPQFTSAKFISSTKMLQIIGQPTDRTETIILNLMPFGGMVSTAADWKPGTYDFDPIHVSNLEYLASAEYNKWNGSNYEPWFTHWDYVKIGKIEIESNNGTHIKGTFHFDAVKKNNNGTYDASSIKKITEGKFDLDIKIY